MKSLKETILSYSKLEINQIDKIELQKIVDEFILATNSGEIRAANKTEGEWISELWFQEGINLIFKSKKTKEIGNIEKCLTWYDKIPMQFIRKEVDILERNIRLVPGSFVRDCVHIGKNTVIMPSFINIGAYIGNNTMIDIWSCIGSCAQIGENCHISGHVLIGGVLEPVGSRPTIIENNCTIGANSSISEGVIIEEGSVIAAGCNISSSTPIINRETGETLYGRIPSKSVVVSGTRKDENNPDIFLNACIIVKKIDKNTLSKTELNNILRQ